MRLATPRIARRATPTYSGLPGIVNSTTASPSLVATGSSVLLLELRQSVGLAAIDVEDLGETCDLEDPQNAHIVTDKPQIAVALASALEAADQNAEPRAIQILHVVQIHHQVDHAPIQQVHHL